MDIEMRMPDHEQPQIVAEQGSCIGMDPEIFFPTTREGSQAAKAICLECPALEACREWALPMSSLEGVFGATSRHDRDQIRRERKEAPAA